MQDVDGWDRPRMLTVTPSDGIFIRFLDAASTPDTGNHTDFSAWRHQAKRILKQRFCPKGLFDFQNILFGSPD